jgi:hypothetical protein
MAASPASGVNTLTGEGSLQRWWALRLSSTWRNSPSFEDKASGLLRDIGLATSGRRSTCRRRAHIALSVRRRRPPARRAVTSAQRWRRKRLIKASKVPYTIVHSTQFFEFLGSVAQTGTDGKTVRLSPAFVQPIAADDVAAALTDIALGAPGQRHVEIAGPERARLAELVQRFFTATHDNRTVMADVHARYFGAELNDRSLMPGDNARVAPTRFEEWLTRSRKARLAEVARHARSLCFPARRNEDDGCQLVEEAVMGRALSTRSCTGRPHVGAVSPRKTDQLHDRRDGRDAVQKRLKPGRADLNRPTGRQS